MTKRFWKTWVLAALAVVAGFTLTFVWPQHNGFDINASPRAQAARTAAPYDLTRLQVLNRVVVETKSRYVDPERVIPKRMFLSGLNAIQQNVAPVLVHYEPGSSELSVQVRDEVKAFGVDDVNSPWALTSRFREVFGFLQSHLNDEDVELQKVEYAAVNGMLRSLDPHSVLLTPDVFDEMQMSTRGEFGGLGIVISIRDGHLTVIKPMPGTPAARGGLERGDRIVKINDEATLNMPLSEAVDRLRGRPGSTVDVWLSREKRGKRGKAFKVKLTRAVIHIDSVESRRLKSDVGYIRIKNFQGNTFTDLKAALTKLEVTPLKGLVLDLRGNPGGLLDQAVKVTDLFLESGTIVTTSANDPSQREQKFAQKDGTMKPYPMIVLVNGSSASASEIVAGALKNHDRALIVGQRTFGKGSVQVLYNLTDGSALKLTVAQYLTPGDLSIQSVGVQPDIQVAPMTVDPLDMDLRVDQGRMRESDLQSHLENRAARQVDQGALTLGYHLPTEVRRRLRTAMPEEREENEQEAEFLLRFSKTLLSGRQLGQGRLPLLEAAAEVVKTVGAEELQKVSKALAKVGVDWSAPRNAAGRAKLSATARWLPSAGAVKAGEALSLEVSVKNEGDAPAYRVSGVTASDFDFFDQRELVFGKVAPGASRSWIVPLGSCFPKQAAPPSSHAGCRLPEDMHARADGIRVELTAEGADAPKALELRSEIEAVAKPNFAYAFQLNDGVELPGDGFLQVGEHATLQVRVRNTGPGRAAAPEANLRNLSGKGVLLHRGRFTLKDLEPGETQRIDFTFEVAEAFQGEQVRLELAISDAELGRGIREKLDFELAPALKVRKLEKTAALAAKTALRARPRAGAEEVARVTAGGTVRVDAEVPGFVRVKLVGDQVAWVESTALKAASAGEQEAAVQHLLLHTPPDIKIHAGDLRVTRDAALSLRGEASDAQSVRDLYIFVGARKVYYRSFPRAEPGKAVSWSAQVPLEPGLNYVTVVARENADVSSRRVLVVRRDGPQGELLESDRHGDAWLLAEWDPAPSR